MPIRFLPGFCVWSLLFMGLLTLTPLGLPAQAYGALTPCDSGSGPVLGLNTAERTNSQEIFLVGWRSLAEEALAAADTPQVGAEVLIVRCVPPGREVLVAQGVVRANNGVQSEALVQLAPEPAHLDSYPRPMAGDRVRPVHKTIKRASFLAESVVFPARDLFLRTSDGTYSFSLSDDGQRALKTLFAKWKTRNGRLVVEGFLQKPGSREVARVESLMRAQAVSSFFVRQFSLQPQQVIALGLGGDTLQSGFQPYAVAAVSEGVVLKLVAGFQE